MAKSIKVRIAPKSGDPTIPIENGEIYKARNSQETSLDIRDRLAELVTQGNTIDPKQRSAIYSQLQSMIGEGKARKILEHAYIFNQRPDVQKLSPEDKLKTYYSIGSSDPEMQALLTHTKSLGYGVVPGYRSSTSVLNQPLPTSVAMTEKPEFQKKIMVKVTR